MKKVVLLLVIVLCIPAYFFLRGSRDRKLISRGNEIIQRIEAFKSNQKRLPNSLSEVGIGEEELFYNKYDSIHYIVWYGTSLGESVTYYSDSKKWEEGDRGFEK